MELLLLDITVASGCVLRLRSLIALSLEVEERPLLCWTSLCFLLRIPVSPNLSLPLEGDSGHELEPLSGEFEVVDSSNDAFGEQVVRWKAPPFIVIARPGTLGKAVLRGPFVHGPQEKMECGLDGDKCSAECWYMCWARLRTMAKQCCVDLLVALILRISDSEGLDDTVLVLYQATSNSGFLSVGT